MKRFKRFAVVSLVLLFAAVGISCGGGTGTGCSGSGCGGGGNPPPVTITISPTSASLPNYVNGSSTQQKFTGTVTNATDTSVTFQVNGVNGGDATHGTIDANGNYVPPGVVPNDSITVTAIANADSSKTASATVKVAYGRPAVNATWQVKSPFGSSMILKVRADVSNSNALYALSYNGGSGTYWPGTVGKNGSVQWTKSTNAPPSNNLVITDLWANGTTVYAMDFYNNFYRTTDGGKTWSRNNFSGSNVGGVAPMTVDSTGNNVFVGLSDGLYESPDGGTTWKKVCASCGGQALIDQRQPGATYVYAPGSDGNSLAYSKDGGQTWNLSSIGMQVLDVAIDPKSSSALYVLAGFIGSGQETPTLFHGDTVNGWTQVATNLDAACIATDSTGLLYACGTGIPQLGTHTFYVSSDGGQTFTPDDTGMPTGARAIDILVLANGSMFVPVANYGVYGTTNGGAQWSFQSNGMTAWAGSTVVASTKCVYFADSYGGGIFRSCDGLKTWTALPGTKGYVISQVGIDPFNGSNLGFSIVGIPGYGGPLSHFLYSMDGGNTWQANGSLNGAYVGGITFDPSAQGTVYLVATLSGTTGVMLSTTGMSGTFHFLPGAGLSQSGGLTSPVGINPANPKELFLGGATGTYPNLSTGIYKSTDGGSSWSFKSSATTPISFSFDARAKLIYASAEGGDTVGSLVSIDDGETWQPSQFGDGIIADPAAAGSAFSDGYSSINGGSTGSWSPDGGIDGLPDLSLGSLGDVLLGYTYFPAMAIVPASKPEQVCATSPIVGLVCANVGP